MTRGARCERGPFENDFGLRGVISFRRDANAGKTGDRPTFCAVAAPHAQVGEYDFFIRSAGPLPCRVPPPSASLFDALV